MILTECRVKVRERNNVLADFCRKYYRVELANNWHGIYVEAKNIIGDFAVSDVFVDFYGWQCNYVITQFALRQFFTAPIYPPAM